MAGFRGGAEPQFTVALDAFNAMNHVNYLSYVGDLDSPFLCSR